jgi:NADPH:quinone reductase-like Zn-dependent oxidoreductase
MTGARKWVAVGFGGPEVLRCIDVDVPDPGRGQVTIGVRASGMNPADAKHGRRVACHRRLHDRDHSPGFQRVRQASHAELRRGREPAAGRDDSG